MTSNTENQASGAAPSPARSRGSGVQTVYETLRTSILDLTLLPGSPLDEMKLAEQFGLSRTPIREAMVRLAAEGLLTTPRTKATRCPTVPSSQHIDP